MSAAAVRSAGIGLGVLAVAVSGASMLAPLPAAADCAGPTIEYSAGEFARGETIFVDGIAFGDNCYDTGPPPEGEGTLGRPLGPIDIFFRQGDDEVLVASGSADADYRFSVEIELPAVLEPGEVEVRVVTGRFEPWNQTDRPLVITDEPPPDANGEVDLVEFGPAPGAEAPIGVESEAEFEGPVVEDTFAVDDADGGSGTDWSVLWWVAAGLVPVGIVLGMAVVDRRR